MREEHFLSPFLMRAVHLGVAATVATLATIAIFAALPHDGTVNYLFLFAVVAATVFTLLLVWKLPWSDAMKSGKSLGLFYVWSAMNITLISLAVAATGGGESDLFLIYGVMVVFSGLVIRPRAQTAMFGAIVAAYALVQVLTDTVALAGNFFVRVAFLGMLGFFGSFLSRELLKLIKRQRHIAMHDALTGLPNRDLFRDRVEMSIAHAKRNGKAIVLLMMDLDSFKEVNDTLGHPRGDMLLKQLGQRLAGAVRDMDTVARLGGDEFAILAPGFHATSDIETFAERILEVFMEPFQLKEMSLRVDCSLGAAVFPDHGEDVDTLLQRADVAMYVSKEKAQHLSIYSPVHDRHSTRRLMLMSDLRGAVERGEIKVYYQPIVDLSAQRILGAEALARWDHPEMGLIPPDEFIPLAEQSGIIRDITRHVIHVGLCDSKGWSRDGIERSVSVNLSVKDLQDRNFPDEVSELLQSCGRESEMLEFEITENSIMADLDRSTVALGRLKSLGVGFAIDDYGTGHSSLASLKRLPVDIVKIDRTFVMNMARDDYDRVIVRSTIDLTHTLGMKVVAEGVESEDIMRQLLFLGCERVQGYHISRPLPGDEFSGFVDNWKPVVTTEPVPQAG